MERTLAAEAAHPLVAGACLLACGASFPAAAAADRRPEEAAFPAVGNAHKARLAWRARQSRRGRWHRRYADMAPWHKRASKLAERTGGPPGRCCTASP